MGMPPRPAGRFSRLDGEEEEDCEWGLGKMVERVPRGVRCRIRRARMADSYDVGILRLGGIMGLLKMCWGEGRMLEEARGRRERMKGNCILRD